MYLDIEDYGVVGNPRTAALVGRNGSIDWCCFPDFDSPSVFAGILDDEDGGEFAVDLADGSPAGQEYAPATNVLRTTLSSPSGTVRVVDFMPQFVDRGDLVSEDELVRIVRCVEGEPTVRIDFRPRFDYGRAETTVRSHEAGAVATASGETLSLSTPADLADGDGAATGTVTLAAGDRLPLVCRYGDGPPEPVDREAVPERLERTTGYWRRWADRCSYDGRWEDDVVRSALALKLLTYEPTGAMVAAATTSLPEIHGGGRNWDYRFTWVRDAIFSAWSLHQLDYHEVGLDFLRLMERTLAPDAVAPLVDVEGEPAPDEAVLDHLEGYRGNDPVRIGNAAADQDQWDSYGAMIDGEYFAHRKLGGVPTEVYTEFVRPAVDYICEIKDDPDRGIWEVRGEKRHFTSSKAWCWVAIDRGIKIARGQGFRDDAERWTPHRDALREEILERSWSDDREAFTMAYETEALDASVLLMPLVGFLPATHPKMKRTIDAIAEGLGDGALLYRYRPEAVHSDPIQADDMAFTTCSFWWVACLARLGRIERATEVFETLLDHGNHLGLYAEEIDPSSGEHLGNFPQAYVHMGLINAAVELDRARE